MPTDGGNFILSSEEADSLVASDLVPQKFIRPFLGASEVMNGRMRHCIWIEEDTLNEALLHKKLKARIELVRQTRLNSDSPTTRITKVPPHRFMQIEGNAEKFTIAVPAITSVNREYLPATLLDGTVILSNKCYALYDAPLWNLALAASKLHQVWVGTVCARMRSDFSYSNTLGWNTFPIPVLTEQNKEDLNACAEAILLAREAHFPATMADLYEVKDGESQMPENLRMAHERNDEVIERIYIGRRFKNDTERLEKLFEMYTKMTADTGVKKKGKKA